MSTPATRSRLLSLLSEACELEHGLACSYLYAAFSLKQGTDEGGLDWSQLQRVRLWASQIYFVASQEMLHLALVWNLLGAIGGAPYYFRPNFPQSRAYYGFHHPLILEPFGEESLRRFIRYETPAEVMPADMRPPGAQDPDAPVEFRTIGALYGQIREAIEVIPEADLFIGAGGQVGPQSVDFPDLIAVGDRQSALAAVDAITEQGEGTQKDRVDCHFGVFRAILSQLHEARAADAAFEPARQALVNPAPRARADWQAGGRVHPIRDDYARQSAELFDDVYALMLRLLQHVFAGGPDAQVAASFARAAIGLMPAVLKPLGEAVMLLPADHPDGPRAGPAFGLSRHTPLPADGAVALRVAGERGAELATAAEFLAADPRAPDQLGAVARNLRRIVSSLSAPEGGEARRAASGRKARRRNASP